MVQHNRRQTLRDLTARFNNSTPYAISKRTVQRQLHGAGFKRRVIAKPITIRSVNRAKTRGFCREKYHWNVREHWSRKKVSDETQVVIEKNKKIYAWRRSQETFMPQCLGQYGDQDRQSVLSVMFWGCITYKGVGELVSVQGNILTF